MKEGKERFGGIDNKRLFWPINVYFMGCKECGSEIVQTPKKRPKEFCNATCRSNFWQKQKRKGIINPNAKPFKTAVKDKKTGRLKVVSHKIAPAPVTVTITPTIPEQESEFDRIMREAGEQVLNNRKNRQNGK